MDKTTGRLETFKKFLSDNFGKGYIAHLIPEPEGVDIPAGSGVVIEPTVARASRERGKEVDPFPFERTRTLPEDFAVHEVYTDNGRTVSMRPVDEEKYKDFNLQALGEYDQLIWKAACVTAATGIKIDVQPAGSWTNNVRDWDAYQIGAGSSTAFTYSFERAWTYLNGMQHGAEAILAPQRAQKLIDELKEQNDLT